MFDRRTRAEERSRQGLGVSICEVATDVSGRLATVAALDSQRLPEGPWLVAEVDGTALALLSLSTGSFVADPFSPTVGLRAMLEARAGRPNADSTGGRRSPLRRRRLLRALGA